MTKTEFIGLLASHTLPNTFNPWAQVCATELNLNGHLDRQGRLAMHLNNPGVELVVIGEAPGYQGCRYSGVAFTSERLLLEGKIPRMPDLQGQRITKRPKPWSEPSATIVWSALHELGLANKAILHNAFPFHPQGKNGIHSNRTPTENERQFGLELLREFLDIYDGVRVAALGNTASTSLNEMGVSHTKLRHPANGGATKFRTGLKEMFTG